MSKLGWHIRFTFIDNDRDEFILLGGADLGDKSEEITRAGWLALEAEPDSRYIADLWSPDCCEDDRCISPAQIEIIMGKPLDELKAGGYAENKRLSKAIREKFNVGA